LEVRDAETVGQAGAFPGIILKFGPFGAIDIAHVKTPASIETLALAERLRIALCCSGWELMARCSFGGHAGLQGKGKRGANACGKYSAKAMPGAGKVVERGKGTSENRSEP
jgi:hypothetical protein